MKTQQGAVVLLVASVLLVGALMISMASYKPLFYQIKRSNNEIESRQEYWLAEGGLECALAINKANTSYLPTAQDYSRCEPSQVAATRSLTNASHFEVTSNVNGRVALKKHMRVIGRPIGAIQARSDLMLIGSYQVVPEFIAPNVCVSIRFQRSLILRGGFVTLNPTGHRCASDAMTNTQKYGLCPLGAEYCDDTRAPNDYRVALSSHDPNYIGDGKVFEHDVVYDSEFDPFDAVFGAPRSQLTEIKRGFEVVSGTVSSSGDGHLSCADKVERAFTYSDKVWVEGDCDLEAGLGVAFNAQPKLLVIENGLLSVAGADTFPGTIYHLYTSAVGNMTAKWTPEVSNTSNLGSLSAAEKARLTFFASGSFRTLGGYIFDTEGGLSVFSSSMDLTFDSAAVPNDHERIDWLRGSWRDL